MELPAGVDDALQFFYDNRSRQFDGGEGLAAYLLEGARPAAEESPDWNLTHVLQGELWNWFTRTLYNMLTVSCFEVPEIAAFAEYMISVCAADNGAEKESEHQKTNGQEKNAQETFAMLLGTFVCMRFDRPCAVFSSKEDYLAKRTPSHPYTLAQCKRIFADEQVNAFLAYYSSLCPRSAETIRVLVSREKDGSFVIHPVGVLDGSNCDYFAQRVHEFFMENPHVEPVVDCAELMMISTAGAETIDRLLETYDFRLDNLNFDCSVSLRLSGVIAALGNSKPLPRLDITGCRKIAEGANGRIFSVNSEQIAKVFKRHVNFDDIQRERVIMRNALVAGIPCPISFGYADVEGNIALVMEMIHSDAMIDLYRRGECDDDMMKRYVELLYTLHHTGDDYHLSMFPKNGFEKDVLRKADLVDPYLGPAYRGLCRKMVESLDEPEVLIHGDIQPSNVLMCGDELILIDFDTFSTGKVIFDLAALYRTMVAFSYAVGEESNVFLKLSLASSEEFWKRFLAAYYKDQPAEYVLLRENQCKVIAYVMMLSFMAKREYPKDALARTVAAIESALDVTMGTVL